MVYSDGLYALTQTSPFLGGLEVHSMPITWSAGVQRDAEKVLPLEYIKVVQNTFPLCLSYLHKARPCAAAHI